MTLVRVNFASGAGRGCDRYMLGLVRDGRVVAAGIERTGLWDHTPLALASSALQRQLGYVPCSDVVETPLLDKEGRAYVLFDNIAKNPGRVERMRLLAGARHGIMQALTRLSWKARNTVLPLRSP